MPKVIQSSDPVLQNAPSSNKSLQPTTPPFIPQQQAASPTQTPNPHQSNLQDTEQPTPRQHLRMLRPMTQIYSF